VSYGSGADGPRHHQHAPWRSARRRFENSGPRFCHAGESRRGLASSSRRDRSVPRKQACAVCDSQDGRRRRRRRLWSVPEASRERGATLARRRHPPNDMPPVGDPLGDGMAGIIREGISCRPVPATSPSWSGLSRPSTPLHPSDRALHRAACHQRRKDVDGRHKGDHDGRSVGALAADRTDRHPAGMRRKGGWVYIMTNRPNGTLYLGVTSDLARRVHEHRKGLLAGFTRTHGLKRLVWYEWHDEIAAAIQRETSVKRCTVPGRPARSWRAIQTGTTFTTNWRDRAGRDPALACHGRACPDHPRLRAMATGLNTRSERPAISVATRDRVAEARLRTYLPLRRLSPAPFGRDSGTGPISSSVGLRGRATLALGRPSPPPQLCGPISASVGLRARVGRLAEAP
jgi:putative endonuclease